jgi:hypothetical protein
VMKMILRGMSITSTSIHLSMDWSDVCEWEASSFHRYVKLGIYPLDWAGDISEDGSLYGERHEH